MLNVLYAILQQTSSGDANGWRTWVPVASVIVAALALLVATFNHKTAKKALRLSLLQEERRVARLDLSLIEAISWRPAGGKGRWIGMRILPVNPTDRDGSLVTADLHLAYTLASGVGSVVKIPHATGAVLPENISALEIPAQLQANGAIVGWLIFRLDDGLIPNDGAIERYDSVIRDSRGPVETVQAWCYRRSSMVKPHKEKVEKSDFVPIVGDASLAGPVAEGSNVPLIIIDTSEWPDTTETIRVNAYLPGDVLHKWGKLKGRPDDVLLILDFQNPVEARVILRFSIEAQGILVEGALTAKAIYLQPGKAGDRFMDDPNRPKILVELPESGFRAKWDEIFLDRMAVVARTKFGIPKREAKARARELIEHLRVITSFRMLRR